MSSERAERKTVADPSNEAVKNIWGFLKSIAQGLLEIGKKKSS